VNTGEPSAFRIRRGNSPQDFAQKLLNDSDNVLILALILMLIKQKSNKALIIALMSILMQE
jgi:hypothetical protein